MPRSLSRNNVSTPLGSGSSEYRLTSPRELKGRYLHETYNSNYFDHGKDILGFSVALDAEHVNCDDDGQEDGDEESPRNCAVPVFYCQ